MSKVLHVAPRSDEWNKLLSGHIVSTEAHVIMKNDGDSVERLDLLRDKATGEIEKPGIAVIEDETGRPQSQAIIEDSIGDEFYSAAYVADNGYMIAALHGVDITDSMIFRHHPWHSALAEDVKKGELPPLAYWQLEFELMVSQAESAVFVVSDGSAENFASIKYESDPNRAEKLAAECERFMQDLRNEQNRTLPALTYRLDGLAVRSNLDEYQSAADQLVSDSRLPIQNDADYDNRKLLIKALETGEKRLGEVQGDVMGEITDVDAFIKKVQKIQGALRAARLATQKLVTSEGQRIKNEIAVKATRKFSDYKDTASGDIGYTITVTFDPTQAMKKKRNFESMEKAVNEALDTARTSVDSEADKARANLALYKAAKHDFLFPDLAQFVFSPVADFKTMVDQRVSDHAEAEKKRLEAEREKIRKEEQEKAEREAEEKRKKEEAERVEQAAKIQREKEQAAKAETVEGDMLADASEMGLDDHVEAVHAAEPTTVPVLNEQGKIPETRVSLPKAKATHVIAGGSTKDLRNPIKQDVHTVEVSVEQVHRIIEDFDNLAGDIKTSAPEVKRVREFLLNIAGQAGAGDVYIN